MSVPYRNCELSRKDIRSVGQFELDYAPGWILYLRSSYTGSCSRNGRNDYTSSEQPPPLQPALARYNRYKVDYTIVSRAVIQRKSVTDAQQCARECDLHRSIYECQAFAFTYVLDSICDLEPLGNFIFVAEVEETLSTL